VDYGAIEKKVFTNSQRTVISAGYGHTRYSRIVHNFYGYPAIQNEIRLFEVIRLVNLDIVIAAAEFYTKALDEPHFAFRAVSPDNNYLVIRLPVHDFIPHDSAEFTKRHKAGRYLCCCFSK
jgi:hypothetical protein